MHAQTFEAVVIAEGNHRRSFSAQEFLSLPLSQRISYVMENKAAFYEGGLPVDAGEALGRMRRQRPRIH